MYNTNELNTAAIEKLINEHQGEAKEDFLDAIESYIKQVRIQPGDWIKATDAGNRVYKVISSSKKGFYTVESQAFRGTAKIYGDFVKVKDFQQIIKYDTQLMEAKLKW